MAVFSVKRKAFILDALIVVLIFFLVTSFLYQGILQSFDWKLFDVFMNIRRHDPTKSENVVIACIDQISLEFFVDRDISWQWPRDFYARLVSYLSECGAKAIVFDAIFSDPDDELVDSKGKANDAYFGEEIQESGRTYLVVEAHPDSIPENPFDARLYLHDEGLYEPFRVKSYDYAVFPIKILSHGVKGVGLANIEPENDGIIRISTHSESAWKIFTITGIRGSS